jgi:peptidoglycan/xylan/chitin deacetylase (PgdA/CDA1 family)
MKLKVIFLIVFAIMKVFTQTNIIFRIDDFGIDDEEIYPKLFKIFEKNNIKLVVGVVPFKSDSGKFSGLTNRQVDILKDGLQRGIIEVAQHGYSHSNNLKSNKYFSEFVGSKYSEQFRKISAGKSYLEQLLNIKIKTFIPPWNSYDENTLDVLVNLNFSIISAALYGAISIKDVGVSFLPYTVTIENILNLYEEEKGLSLNSSNLYIILIHNYKSNDNYENGQLDVIRLEKLLEHISKNKNFKNATLLEIKTISYSRFLHNVYYQDFIPVFYLNQFRNKGILDIEQFNYIKYLRILYQFIFYPIVSLLTFLLFNNLKIYILKIVYLNNNTLLIVICLSIIFSFILFDLKPIYLTIISMLFGLAAILLSQNFNLSKGKNVPIK